MPPEDIVIQLRINDRTQNTLEQVKRDLREINQLQGGAGQTNRADIRVAQIQRERSAEEQRSREHITNIRTEQQADNNRSREAVISIRQQVTEDNNRSREKIANINRESAAQRQLGQDASRSIQRQRLEEQRLAREQRDRHFQLRQRQRGILAGFQAWSGPIGAVAGLLSGELLQALQRVGARTLEVTRNLEQLRQGYGAFVGSQRLADTQIARIRRLADLPSVGFEGGVRSVLQLQSAGFDFATSERLLRELSNQVALFGGSTDALNRVLYQFTQIGGLQEFRTEELRQVFEITPGLRRTFEDIFGSFRGEEINQAIEGLGLTFDQSVTRILDRLATDPRAPTDTLTNNLERLRESYDDLLRVLGTELSPVLRELLVFLRGGAQGTADVIRFISTASDYLPLRANIDPEVGDRIIARVRERHGEGPFSQTEAFNLLVEEYIRGITPDIVEPAAQFIPGVRNPERARRLAIRQEGNEAIQQLDAAYLGLLPTITETEREINRLQSSIERFNETGTITNSVFESLREEAFAGTQPLRDLISTQRERLIQIANERGQLQETYGILRAALVEVPEDLQLRISELDREAEAIRENNARLQELIETRQQDYNETQRQLQEATRQRLRNRETPDFRVSPDQVLTDPRFRDRRSFYGDREAQQADPDSLTRRFSVRAILTEFFSGRPVGEYRPPLGFNQPRDIFAPRTSSRYISGPITPDSAIFPRATPGLGLNIPLPQFGLGYLSQFGTFRGTALQSGAAGLLGRSDLRSGLLDPSETDDLRARYRSIISSQVDLTRATQLSRSEQEDLRDSVLATVSDLQDVRNQFELLGGVPADIVESLDGAIEQARNSLAALNRQIDIALESARDAREESIASRVALGDESGIGLTPEALREQANRLYNQRLYGQDSPPTRQQAQDAFNRLPGVRANRRRQRQQQLQRAQAISGYFSSSAESLYDQFLAPSVLDAIGIGSPQSAARNRAFEELSNDIERQREEISRNAVLNERERTEQLLEINREYEAEKREIERQYEDERRDAWANWVRQQLIDFPKLIFQQLNLQLAARATNSILNSLNLGGQVPITGPGIGNGGANFLQQIGLGGGSGGGAGFAGTAATVGTAASVALAAHNIITGIGSGLYDDIGQDVGNIFSDIQNVTGNNEGQTLYADVNFNVDGVRAFTNKQTELRLGNRV